MIDKKFFTFLRNKADKLKKGVDPCRGGDGGASVLLQQVDIYLSGLDNVLPHVWQEYYTEFQKENDPDTKERYERYLILKKEFEK